MSDWTNDGHRLRLAAGPDGIKLWIACPHEGKQPPPEGRACQWASSAAVYPNCGLDHEVSELGVFEFLEESLEIDRDGEVMPIGDGTLIEWRMVFTHPDDSPEIWWRPRKFS
jgi:hypothetical protein